MPRTNGASCLSVDEIDCFVHHDAPIIPLAPPKIGPVEEAIVTSGGINVKEINPSTMESRLVKGLYFAGEVIDVDAYTGGYNLQIAFSTGHLAGESVY